MHFSTYSNLNHDESQQYKIYQIKKNNKKITIDATSARNDDIEMTNVSNSNTMAKSI